ncbi:acyl transferase [Crocinitomicaceae bacterium]|nr:acyl transferase [Crocinitomicaceae bacterium]MDB4324257.1 acyl transferase [Crocinitomicaceae bacterium]
MELEDKIFSVTTQEDFERVALEVYYYQIENCKVYRDFVNQLNWPAPTCIQEIPFLPIEFFKTHTLLSESKKTEIIFKSSGTGGTRSTHYVADKSLYTQSFNKLYQEFIGPAKDQVILALLPSYIEQGDSSLVYMVDDLIKQTNNPLSGFILNDMGSIVERYLSALRLKKKVVIFGVSYALLDLAEKGFDFSKALIIETGGMKGKRKELTKTELHRRLRKGLNCDYISSEYGMTELLSQFYSDKDEVFSTTNLIKVFIRETNDPFSYTIGGKTGGINIVDLANIYSCSFIATQDLGKAVENGFQIMGRFDNSDVRGCNLLL